MQSKDSLSLLLLLLCFCAFSLDSALAFVGLPFRIQTNLNHFATKNDFITNELIGKELPEEIAKFVPIHDMVLLERYSQPETTPSGLFVPTTEGKDRKHIAKVIAVPKDSSQSQTIADSHYL